MESNANGRKFQAGERPRQSPSGKPGQGQRTDNLNVTAITMIAIVYLVFGLAYLPHLRTSAPSNKHLEDNKGDIFGLLKRMTMRFELMPVVGPAPSSQPGFSDYFVATTTGEIGRIAIQTKRAEEYGVDCGVVKVMLMSSPEGLIFHPSPIDGVPPVPHTPDADRDQ